MSKHDTANNETQTENTNWRSRAPPLSACFEQNKYYHINIKKKYDQSPILLGI